MDFLGVFLGVVAGTIVNILTVWFFYTRHESQQAGNLQFELDLNIRKIDKWLNEITNWRNAVNGDSLHLYFGYFDFSKALWVTGNNMLQSGFLYKHLSHEQIGTLQNISGELSIYGEQLMNQTVQKGKNLFNVGTAAGNPLWHSQYKAQVVQDINFWQNKLTEHRASLAAIVAALKK